MASQQASAEGLHERTKGDDGSSEMGDLEKKKNEAIRERMRQSCYRTLMSSAVNSKTAFSHKAVEDVMKAFSEEYLDREAKDEKTKMEWVYGADGWDKVVERYVSKAEAYGEKCISLLRQAREEKAISTENFAEWMTRMKDGTWDQTKEFIDNKLPEYVGRWKEVAAERRKLLKDPRIKSLKDSPAMTKEERMEFFSNVTFLNVHYDRRMHLVGLVKTALAGLKHGKPMEELKKVARAQLNEAAAKGILAQNKVGVWMQRIFESEHSPDEIWKFLDSKGSFPLSILMANWGEVKQRFEGIQNLRQKKGTPRSFQFVSMDVFLNWEYERREAYVEEAERRFENIDKVPELFLKIRHELDTKNYAAAEELLKESEDYEWSEEDEAKLRSMRTFLLFNHHEDSTEGAKETESPSPDEVLNEVRGIVNEIEHESIRARFIQAMTHYDYDTLWALCTMYYNWEWCRVHGYSNDEIDEDFRSTAKRDTYHALEGKESETYTENRAITTDTSKEEAMHHEDAERPKVWNVNDSTTASTFVSQVHENRHNRDVWYWTRIVEEHVPFSKVQYMIHNIQPRLKRGMKKLNKMGYRFTTTGRAEPKEGAAVPQKTAAKA